MYVHYGFTAFLLYKGVQKIERIGNLNNDSWLCRLAWFWGFLEIISSIWLVSFVPMRNLIESSHCLRKIYSVGYSFKQLFEGIDLSLQSGKLTCFMGPMGLENRLWFEHLAGLQKPLAGKSPNLVEKKIAFGFNWQNPQLLTCLYMIWWVMEGIRIRLGDFILRKKIMLLLNKSLEESHCIHG